MAWLPLFRAFLHRQTRQGKARQGTGSSRQGGHWPWDSAGLNCWIFFWKLFGFLPDFFVIPFPSFMPFCIVRLGKGRQGRSQTKMVAAAALGTLLTLTAGLFLENVWISFWFFCDSFNPFYAFLHRQTRLLPLGLCWPPNQGFVASSHHKDLYLHFGLYLYIFSRF